MIDARSEDGLGFIVRLIVETGLLPCVEPLTWCKSFIFFQISFYENNSAGGCVVRFVVIVCDISFKMFFATSVALSTFPIC